MDLPPDKAKVLKGYDDEKKWDLICDQVKVLDVILSSNQNDPIFQSLNYLLSVLFDMLCSHQNGKILSWGRILLLLNNYFYIRHKMIN